MILDSDNIYQIDDILVWSNQLDKSKKLSYYDVYISFDIETSSFYDNKEKVAIMYLWSICINGKCVVGRTYEEIITTFKKIEEFYLLNLNHRVIIWVHNLSYEFQFIRKWFAWENVFLLDNRKVVYAVTKSGIEFRCSYILTNSSLDNLARKLTTFKINKLVGALDYTLIRHSKTPINENELKYQLNDVLIVVAYIYELSLKQGDITKIPLTATGFVREDVKKYVLNCKGYYNTIKKLTLDKDEYTLANLAFMGGFTHSNPINTNITLENVTSFDFTSSYPAVMLSERFPMSKGFRVFPKSLKQFNNYLENNLSLLDIEFIHIKANFTSDFYISYYKCLECENPIISNGRVVQASRLRICLTNIDLDIIKKTYSINKFRLYNMYIYKADYLPLPFIEKILNYYEKKTSLKGVKGQEEEYQRNKEFVNSLYGMCVTNIVRDEFIYENEEFSTKSANDEEQIHKYNNSHTRFLSYLWGVFITAYARYNLWTAILELKDDYIYSDTDSVKFLNYENHKDYFINYNKNINYKIDKLLKSYNLNLNRARPKTKDNIEKPIGVWDYEGCYKMFKTLGAKRYILVNENNELEITIAGVGKKPGVKFLQTRWKNFTDIFNNFNDKLTFPAYYYYCDGKELLNASGKLTLTYIDELKQGQVIDYLGNIGEYKELSSVHMEPSEYNLSVEKDFMKLIKELKEIKKRNAKSKQN